MMKQAIKHEVHVQEVEMREYYLPILIGSGAGFVILVLMLSLVICCCCKRKLKRKLKMAKEPEKPPIEGNDRLPVSIQQQTKFFKQLQKLRARLAP